MADERNATLNDVLTLVLQKENQYRLAMESAKKNQRWEKHSQMAERCVATADIACAIKALIENAHA